MVNPPKPKPGHIGAQKIKDNGISGSGSTSSGGGVKDKFNNLPKNWDTATYLLKEISDLGCFEKSLISGTWYIYIYIAK